MSTDSSIGDLATHLPTHSKTFLEFQKTWKNTIIEHSERLVTLESFYQSDEETKHFENYILRKIFWEIHFENCILSHTFWEIYFEKYIWEIHFEKNIILALIRLQREIRSFLSGCLCRHQCTNKHKATEIICWGQFLNHSERNKLAKI